MKQDASGFYNLRGLYNNGLVHSYDLRDVIAVGLAMCYEGVDKHN